MAKPRFYFWALALMVLLSCNNELGEVGFKNPNRDFEATAKEFIIPTKVFLMDSLSTSYGSMEQTKVLQTPAPNRFMVGTATDPNFGTTTAIAYSPYYASTLPVVDATATFQSLELTLVFDYYWMGDPGESTQTFQVYELTDSMLTYRPHYANQSTPYGKLLGETTYDVSPTKFDKNLADNAAQTDASKDIIDSLDVVLDEDLGRALLSVAMDTIGTNERNFGYFRYFHQQFKGLAITSPNSNKVVGFNPAAAKTRLTLNYTIETSTGTVAHQLFFLFSPSGQAVGTPEFMAYTELETDRTGTPLAGLTEKYVDYEPADGNRYIQAGTGVTTKLDLTEVFNYFKEIPIKALSAVELRIEGDEQLRAPLGFKLRALRADNRELRTTKQYFDAANDPFTDLDVEFFSKHSLDPTNAQTPTFRCDPLGDDGTMFLMTKTTSTGSSAYTGYLTTFIQQELSLSETDFLPYYALIPQAPDIARGVNGLYFPADKIKLTVYYTTPTPNN